MPIYNLMQIIQKHQEVYSNIKEMSQMLQYEIMNYSNPKLE